MSLLDGLVSHYGLSQDALETRTDSHGSNDLDPTSNINNDPSGIIGLCQLFAQTHYLQAQSATPFTFGDTSFTVGIWVNAIGWDNDSSLQRHIINKWNSTNGREWQMDWVDSIDRFRFIARDSGDANTIRAEANNFGIVSSRTNEWIFILGWHDADNNQIGIEVNNGTADTTAMTGGIQNTTTNSLLSIGAQAGSALPMAVNKFSGRIDHSSIWSRILTTSEKTFLWNGGSGRPYSEYANSAGGSNGLSSLWLFQ